VQYLSIQKGNIAEALVKEGFAEVVGWSLDKMKPQQANALRRAENEAKKKRLRLWKNYVPSNTVSLLSICLSRNSLESITILDILHNISS